MNFQVNRVAMGSPWIQGECRQMVGLEMLYKKSLAICICLLCLSSVASGPTKVMSFFDTEDFTCDESSDAIRETAKILTEEGVRGEYNIVGYLARELVRLNRRDVIEALKPHAIGTQTLKHSVHPTVCERSDMADYETAYRNVLADESEGVGMLKAAFGLQHVDYAVPPGNSWSYASLYAFADLGMTFYGGGGFGEMGDQKSSPRDPCDTV